MHFFDDRQLIFLGPSWSCIKLRGPDTDSNPVNRRHMRVSKTMRDFSQTEAEDEKESHVGCINEKRSFVPRGQSMTHSTTM